MMNPYAEEQAHNIQSATDLFGEYRLVPSKKKQSERGELLRYFSLKTGRPIPVLVGRFIPPGLTLKDLYYIKSSCDQYERSGQGPWSKAFFGMLKTRT